MDRVLRAQRTRQRRPREATPECHLEDRRPAIEARQLIERIDQLLKRGPGGA